MGSFFSRFVEKLRGTRDVRLLMLGLDNAGKTTILYKLKFNQTVTTIPTAGFNVECLLHKNIKFHVWDVGGQDKIRPLWRHYHTGTKALIFVVDCQDRDRIHEARIELHRILRARELSEAILLIFANKQDLAQSMGEAEVRERLQLERFPDRVWTVQASCATTGEGLMEGLNWLANNIKTPGKSGKRPMQEQKDKSATIRSDRESPLSATEQPGDLFQGRASTGQRPKAINDI